MRDDISTEVAILKTLRERDSRPFRPAETSTEMLYLICFVVHETVGLKHSTFDEVICSIFILFYILT